MLSATGRELYLGAGHGTTESLARKLDCKATLPRARMSQPTAPPATQKWLWWPVLRLLRFLQSPTPSVALCYLEEKCPTRDTRSRNLRLVFQAGLTSKISVLVWSRIIATTAISNKPTPYRQPRLTRD